MGNSAYVSLSHATALERSLNLSAHNLANASTAGYKAVQPVFHVETHGGSGELTTLNFVQDKGVYLDQTQGALTRTDNPGDLAISGSGWFGFDVGGGVAYSRFGQLVVDVDGQLVTAAGQAILDPDGGPVVLPNDAGSAFSIAGDGTITDQNGDNIGQVGVFIVEDPSALTPIGRGMYADPTGGANLEPDETSTIAQGFIEGSNVEAVLEMTRLIDIQRAYEHSVTLMKEESELTKQAIQRLGRGS